MGFDSAFKGLREEHRVFVLGKKVLKKTLKSQRDKTTGSLREICNQELHNLYLSY
jgi:hypothetical protein